MSFEQRGIALVQAASKLDEARSMLLEAQKQAEAANADGVVRRIADRIDSLDNLRGHVKSRLVRLYRRYQKMEKEG